MVRTFGSIASPTSSLEVPTSCVECEARPLRMELCRVRGGPMRRPLLALLMMLTPATLLGQSNLSGDWEATVHLFGSTQYTILHLEQTGEKVTGTIFGTKIECSCNRRCAPEPFAKGMIRRTARYGSRSRAARFRRRVPMRTAHSISSRAGRWCRRGRRAPTSSPLRSSTTISRRSMSPCCTSAGRHH